MVTGSIFKFMEWVRMLILQFAQKMKRLVNSTEIMLTPPVDMV